MRRRLIACLPLAAILAMAGCGGSGGNDEAGSSGGAGGSSDSALVQAAKKEGELSWYSSESEVFNKALAGAFEKKYDIKVKVFSSSSELEQRYAAERGAGRVAADIINNTNSDFYLRGAKEGWFVKLADLNVPNLAAWPKEAKTDVTADIASTPLILAYNTDLVKEEDVPKKWEDLLLPQNRDRLMMGDPRAAPGFLAVIHMWKKEIGTDFVKDLGAAKPRLVQSVVPGNEALAAGERAFLFPNLESIVNPLIKKGAPLKVVKDLGPTTVSVQHQAISTNAPHPNAAQLFMDFCLSAEGQDFITNHFGKDTKVSPAKGLPAGLFPADTVGAVAQRDELLGLLALR